MRPCFLLVVFLLACGLRAEDRAQALAAEIERYAAQEEVHVGLDTRIRAAERLRIKAPGVARQLLENGLPALRSLQTPSNLTYHFMKAYASLDPDAAEHIIAGLQDSAWAYTAVIEVAVQHKDFFRTRKLARSALSQGEYSLGVFGMELETLQRERPQEATDMLRELLAAFPVEKATPKNVISLLTYLSKVPNVDPNLARDAVHKIFQAIDRPDFRDSDPEFEQTATFTVKGQKIKTTTSVETALLPAAAYLSVLDTEAYRQRESSLPEWRSNLLSLTPADLPGVLKAHYVLMQKGLRQRLEEEKKNAPQRPDYSKMTYAEVAAAAQTKPALDRAQLLHGLTRRKDLTADQRDAAIQQVLRLIPDAVPLEFRFWLVQALFRRVIEAKLDAFFQPALARWMETLDAVARSQEIRTVSSSGARSIKRIRT